MTPDSSPLATPAELTGRELLRHTLATLSYRAGKPLHDAPDGFTSYSVAAGTRTPGQILAHLGDLLRWANWLARGEKKWESSAPEDWASDVSRFFIELERLDDYIASGAPLYTPAERLFQGPIADALTHVGQLAMLRRLSGAPVRGENYEKARINVGHLGIDQNAPKFEFD